MEAEFLKYISTGADIGVYIIGYIGWRFDRRLLKLESEHNLFMKHFNKIERGLHLPPNGSN